MGCQPRDQVKMVEQLLEWGCTKDALSHRGDTVIMEVAGAGNVHMFTYLYTRIVKQNWRCDLTAANVDQRNLYSIAGLAHEEGFRPFVNPMVKKMVQHLVNLKIIAAEGLATHYSALRGGRPRIEDQVSASSTHRTEVVQDVEVESGRSRPSSSSAGPVTESTGSRHPENGTLWNTRARSNSSGSDRSRSQRQ